jgi:peptide methionine sulfoxide reductase MsrB
VLRGHGTERAGTSPLDRESRKGLFHCAGCDLPLFDSATKYDSRTGWPSFWAPIEGAVGTSTDRSHLLADPDRGAIARAAAATSATSSTTGRGRPASATA